MGSFDRLSLLFRTTETWASTVLALPPRFRVSARASPRRFLSRGGEREERRTAAEGKARAAALVRRSRKCCAEAEVRGRGRAGGGAGALGAGQGSVEANLHSGLPEGRGGGARPCQPTRAPAETPVVVQEGGAGKCVGFLGRISGPCACADEVWRGRAGGGAGPPGRPAGKTPPRPPRVPPTPPHRTAPRAGH